MSNPVLDAMGVDEFLARLKGLTLNQYDDAKSSVVDRVKVAIGEKPTRASLQRDQGPLLSPVDVLGVIVFVAAFIVSTVHIFNHAGELARISYAAAHPVVAQSSALPSPFALSGPSLTEDLGIVIPGHVYVIAHQLGFLVLAEASMLLFMVTWRLQTRNVSGWLGWRYLGLPRKALSVYLLLATVAAVFVLVANARSGLGPLESLMPPIFTIGLGLHLEGIAVEMLERRAALTSLLGSKLNIWETATDDPTKHPDYRRLLMRELWDRLSKLKPNQELADAPDRLKLAAVHREMARDTWTDVAAVVEQQAAQVQAVTGGSAATAVVLAQSAGSLEQLADLVRAARDDLSGPAAIITLPSGAADLEALVWRDAAQGNRQYGPYKSRSVMAAAIRSVARTNTQRV
jgi:hypothetical protein